MTIHPSKAEFLDYAREGNLIPVYSDLMADFETPVSVYSKLRRSGPAFLLESVEGGANLNRYSFIGCQPGKIISVFPDRTIVGRRDGGETSIPTPPDPLSVIREEMAAFRPVNLPGMPRFVGGAQRLSRCSKPAFPCARLNTRCVPTRVAPAAGAVALASVAFSRSPPTR